MKHVNGTTRAIMRRRITPEQERVIASLPRDLQPGALWRTLKFNHPWPRHRRPRNRINLNPSEL